MRPEQLYLADLVEASDCIGRFLAEIEEGVFLDSDLLQSAVLQKLSIIGESAARLSKELRARHPEVPWPAIIGFRNIAVHAYFSVDWLAVWNTATRDVPELRKQVLAMPEFQIEA